MGRKLRIVEVGLAVVLGLGAVLAWPSTGDAQENPAPKQSEVVLPPLPADLPPLPRIEPPSGPKALPGPGKLEKAGGEPPVVNTQIDITIEPGKKKAKENAPPKVLPRMHAETLEVPPQKIDSGKEILPVGAEGPLSPVPPQTPQVEIPPGLFPFLPTSRMPRAPETKSTSPSKAVSPWTVFLETEDGRTVIQATVHKKGRLKIVCDQVDLQAPRGTLQARGDVRFFGPGFQGQCEKLLIPLNEDRLHLDGKAEVGLRVPVATSPSAGDEVQIRKPPVLEIKGDQLQLRLRENGLPTVTRGGN